MWNIIQTAPGDLILVFTDVWVEIKVLFQSEFWRGNDWMRGAKSVLKSSAALRICRKLVKILHATSAKNYSNRTTSFLLASSPWNCFPPLEKLSSPFPPRTYMIRTAISSSFTGSMHGRVYWSVILQTCAVVVNILGSSKGRRLKVELKFKQKKLFFHRMSFHVFFRFKDRLK